MDAYMLGDQLVAKGNLKQIRESISTSDTVNTLTDAGTYFLNNATNDTGLPKDYRQRVWLIVLRADGNNRGLQIATTDKSDYNGKIIFRTFVTDANPFKFQDWVELKGNIINIQ